MQGTWEVESVLQGLWRGFMGFQETPFDRRIFFIISKQLLTLSSQSVNTGTIKYLSESFKHAGLSL